MLSYIVSPFQSTDKYINIKKQWQAVANVKALGEFGYNVDVIDYDSRTSTLKHKHDLVIDMAPGWYGGSVMDCKRIFYVTGSYPKWAAEESERRREEVFSQRGVRFTNHRGFRSIPEYISDFDGAFMFGNEYNWKTYTDAFKMTPVHFIANSGYTFPYTIDRRHRSPHKFLYFAGGD